MTTSQTTMLAAGTPPIEWHVEKAQSALTAYLESPPVGNTGKATWELYQLAAEATEAGIASGFDTLVSLQHVNGFQPLAHQVETAKQVLQTLRGRAILADEVGLGKTIEAGLVLKEYLLRGLVRKALILTPASLVLQWTRELNEKFRIPVFAQRNEWSWSEYDVVVASLDTAKRDPHREIVMNQAWDMIIIDEAHKLKNPKTKNWQVVNQLPNKYMLLLTATPMQNNLRELHTLVTLLKPGHLGNQQTFTSDYLVSTRTPKDASKLRAHVGDVMIRNRRMDGGVVLPKRNVRAVPIELNQAERKLYDAVHTFLRDEFQERTELRKSVLPLVTLQREICSSPYAAMITMERMAKRTKSERTKESLAQLMAMAEQITEYTKVNKVVDLVEQIGDKCIVFTEYRATQDFLMYMLRKRGVMAVPFRGGFGRGKKDWMKDLFAKRAQVLVATESGGEGINLQFCQHMINFDLPWNPMRLEQRIGRIHRLGQEREVQVYNFATKDTIEEHIVSLLQEKIRMFEMVIGELDYILAEPEQVGRKFEQQVLEWSVTESTKGLRRRLDEFAQEWTESKRTE